MTNAQQVSSWRLKADELRAIADQMTMSLARKTLESMASAYEAMAARAESTPPIAVARQLPSLALVPSEAAPASTTGRLRRRRTKPRR